MFTGVFKDRSTKERAIKGRVSNKEWPRDLLAAAEQALADLLASRELRTHALSRQCEIGPFLVDYVFPQRSLIVELLPAAELQAGSRYRSRTKFLTDMGYVVHGVSPHELLRQPQRVLEKLRALLES
jgi:very-short-patch-repair endonuclease